jgi:hypothetical protein
MGVIVQPLLSKGREITECPSVPSHIRGLFFEFVKRYDEWQSLRRKEGCWLALVVFLGLLSLTSFMWMPYTTEWVTFGFFVFFIAILTRYMAVKRDSIHAYVNVHILHHHLLGKLEVGFCDHEKGCQCAVNFRKYVWEEYQISLYGNSI